MTLQFNVVLTVYEIANLRSLIEACGYGLDDRVERNPLWVGQTGDWIGQIYQKLPAVDYPPNADAHELARRAKNFV